MRFFLGSGKRQMDRCLLALALALPASPSIPEADWASAAAWVDFGEVDALRFSSVTYVPGTEPLRAGLLTTLVSRTSSDSEVSIRGRGKGILAHTK